MSNIAWDVSEDEAVANLLIQKSVDAIDIAPTKYFPASDSASASSVERVRRWWEERGIGITGMQALLFGTTGLNLFGAPEVRQAMLSRLGAVSRIAQGLGATRLVFGSPKNRDRGQMTEAQANAIAVPFFCRLGDMAAECGVRICLEPNPVRYGCNFLTTTANTATIVRLIDHPAICLHLDTGSLAINGEDPGVAIRENADIIGHVHASEPDLVPLRDGSVHALVATELRRFLPRHVVSVEMLATKDELHATAVERALDVAIRCYGGDNPVEGDSP
jgi:D-psicose/D-tagatose/L-ribulose 3-epimerase